MNEALRLLRVFNDLKSGELAEKLELSSSYISELESGKKTPSLEVIQKYANFFETTPSSIMLMAEGLNKKPQNLRAKLSRAMLGFLQNIEKHGEA